MINNVLFHDQIDKCNNKKSEECSCRFLSKTIIQLQLLYIYIYINIAIIGLFRLIT